MNAFNIGNRRPEPAKDETNNGNVAITTGNSDSIGEQMQRLAVQLADVEGNELSQAISTVMKAKEDWQGGPFRVLFAMQKTYSEEQLARFPEPDSEGGNNPDKYKISVTDKNGRTALRNSSFYIQFADATKEGKAILNELEMISRASNAEAIKDGIPPAIMEMNPVQRETRKAYLENRRVTIRGSYKKAMALAYQFDKVNSLSDVVAEPFLVEGQDDEVENTTKPIHIYSKSAPAKHWDAYSISSFLKLDPAKAAEQGGTFAALKATIRRAPGAGQGKNGETVVPPVKTIDTLEDTLTNAYSFLDEIWSDPKQQVVGQLYKKLNSAGSDDFLRTVFGMKDILTDICRKDKYAARYARLMEEEDKDEKAA